MKKTLKLKNIIISAVVILGGMLLFTPKALAATKTVCASGCDYTTVQAAIDAATTGDTITINVAGSYAGFSSTGTKNLTITSASGLATLPVITSAVTLSSSGTTIVTALNISGTTVTATAGTVTLLNNKLGSLTASGTAAVDAKGNYWNSSSPDFDSLITISDTATVVHEPYYTVENMLGSNITSITLNTASQTIEVGEQYAADITVVSVGDYIITWASSNETTATVSDAGVISALAVGTTTVTGTTTYGDILSISIEVVAEGTTSNPETSLELYIVAFGALVLIGGYIGIQSYKKRKEMM
ncbi:MAG TPA: Ig-like domain-containing protein [Bacilli bacterium]|nr:Ig-like domain-containing protein [Bacilli bacterium]